MVALNAARRAGVLALALVFLPLPVRGQGPGFPGVPARTGPITATVDATQVGAPVDRFFYGYFTENLGNMFEGGLWAEMLGDRKFYNPITADTTPPPGRGPRRVVGRWRPLGGAVAMDSARAWVGKHSPRLALDASTARGIQQRGLGLIQGRAYTGRVVMAADGKAKVTVALVWGSGAGDRQTVSLSPSSRYRTYPFHFTAGATNRDGVLQISATGAGDLRIGAVSLMPADNVEGFRPDMIAMLKSVHPGMIRWGGNFSSGYNWRDGIGPYDKRPPRWDYAWNVVEQNDVGVVEIIALARLLGAELEYGVNSGFGDVNSAAEVVEYVNGSVNTLFGRLRAAHGHPQPFGVKWWGIGNEMYGEWQMGHMAIDQYVIKHNAFAEAMRAVDPSIKLVASGATVFEMSTVGRLARKPLPSNRPYAYDSPEDWTGRLLRGAGRNNIDWVAEHIYAIPDGYFDAGQQEFRPATTDPVEYRMRRIANRVRSAVEAMQEYQRRMPYVADRKIKLALDEYSTGGVGTGEMSSALTCALVLNEMARTSQFWGMSAYTGLTGLLAYDRSGAAPALRANGLLFKLYTEHLGPLPLALTGDSPQPEVRGTIGVDRGSAMSGSPTYPLDVLATLSQDRKTLTVAVANPSETEQVLKLTIQGVGVSRAGQAWTLSVPDPSVRTMPGGRSAATVVESEVPDGAAPLAIPASTFRLYEFKVQ